ncbi:abortive infection family protein [Cytobacillus firmus]|uniref:abortive infection family protein n=1 Tax=Cytobacillus firmus TaxID=1399 RepID=UPI0018CE773E|nr:abortive infection family protein [Cytobacillus firmus]
MRDNENILNKADRFRLINQIAVELQQTMSTTDINVFLGGFNVAHELVSIVPSKRTYVINLLSNVSDDLVINIANELGLSVGKNIDAVYHLDQLLKKNYLNNIYDDFNRCIKNIENDPDQAIASASSTLESICKSILDFLNEEYPKDQSLSSLVSKTFTLLDLSPVDHSDSQIKRILGGLTNAALGIGVLRTGFSSAHGKGSKQYRLNKRHARLIVNSMSTIGLFVLETYYEKYDVTS